MATIVKDVELIEGWGIDANPENDPTYPMRDSDEEAKEPSKAQRPSLQDSSVEILKSTERPTLSAVFGTSVPPRGLSGMIRRRAFRRSESKWMHWLMLMLADRVDMVEGIFGDFAHGRFPNIYAETGMRSEKKFAPRRYAMKMAGVFVVFAIIVLAIVALFHQRTAH